jgi:radical SAM superfamily enzyme YgiQ (UPF0313 family)
MSTNARCSPIRIIQNYLQKKDLETKVYDFWYNPLITEDYDDYRTWGLVQDIPRYEDVLKALKGEFNKDEGPMMKDIVTLANEIDVSDGTIFGFSTTVLSHYLFILFASIIKKRNPKVITVFGGYHTSLGTLYNKFLLDSNLADFVVKNDGCKPLYDIYTGKQIERYIVGGFLNNFWPEFDRIDANISCKTLPTISSFGCPNNCYFCASDRDFVDCDQEAFFNYLLRMKSVGFQYVELVDDNPNITKEKFIKLCKIMKKVGIQSWLSFANPVVILDEIPESCGLMKLLLGTENFNDNVLKAMNKKQTVKQMFKSIDFWAKNGIKLHCPVILGFPGETEETFNDSFENMKILHKEYEKNVMIWPIHFRLFPGSYVYNNAQKFNLKFSYFPGTTIPKTFSIDGMNIELIKDRASKIKNEFPQWEFLEKANPYLLKNILVKR